MCGVGRDAGALLTIRQAVENASTDPITDEAIIGMLRGEGASGAHLAALFGDVPLQALARAGRAAGIGLGTILAAYAEARRVSLARNPELDAALEAASGAGCE